MAVTTGVVLAGGGLAGIAWEAGVLTGIADIDPELAARIGTADVIVGSSAGSVVAAHLSGPAALYGLYLSQLTDQTAEIEINFDETSYQRTVLDVTTGAHSVREYRMRLVALARGTETVAQSRRREVVGARMTAAASWPAQRNLWITAIDANSAERVVFTGEDGIELADAVTASCAIPGIWPLAVINGCQFIDGATPSVTNADLAGGCDQVLVITPLTGPTTRWWDLRAEIAALAPARVAVIQADRSTVPLFMDNPLSPRCRRPAAQAGRALGRRTARWLAEWIR
ncbi:hypothetical protein CQY20_06395 [Mycolicibacterium agri]|uniref:Phospholipase n=1 Tax=Mycolicibacterium agri TaxID=36811 RepID=A0A2A7NA25_MYCAG|nr:patatin-like phospholipase family protein [Mycolicibacterium agri]PEG40895.1 hypothetical protein CQY20_06395 [Mycolicibacterium agri]GFG52256.1 phospholipase [Mycolicibacterium agri]